MSIDLRGRDFVKEIDFTADELIALLDVAATIKASGRQRQRHLERRCIALIFEKTSTRTRCAFEVGAHHQGADVTYLDPTGSQFGHKESAADSARLLSRMFDGIQFRGRSQETVETLAEHSRVPVFNGLTDDWHPTQMLADFLTMREHATSADLRQVSFAYLGDARNNMGNSLLVTGAILGTDVRIVAPRALWPGEEVQALARAAAEKSGAQLLITEDLEAGVNGAEFVHTDVWVSMGEPTEVWDERVTALRDYRVTDRVMAMTGRGDSKFMHCLPAYHDRSTPTGRHAADAYGLADGIEVSTSVFAGPRSIVWDQGENRLHTIEGLMVATLGDLETGAILRS
ncbi:MAG: ornithine carbamoyltransferase [Candidatus Nanopelagicales bacterium]